MLKRANNTEKQKRIDVLLNLKTRGYRYTQLVEAGMKYWNISDREVKRYLSEIKKQEAQAGEAPRSETFGVLSLRLEALYAQAMSDGNFQLARQTLMDMTKLEESKYKISKQRGQINGASGPQIPEADDLEKLLATIEKGKPAKR